MQYTIFFFFFFCCKNEKFHWNLFFIFLLIFAQNIDCGYMLEPPRTGGSNEYPQSTFWIKTRYSPVNPSFTILKWGMRGTYILGTCFPDSCQYFGDNFSAMS